jgi:hypothetical protein
MQPSGCFLFVHISGQFPDCTKKEQKNTQKKSKRSAKKSATG